MSENLELRSTEIVESDKMLTVEDIKKFKEEFDKLNHGPRYDKVVELFGETYLIDSHSITMYLQSKFDVNFLEYLNG